HISWLPLELKGRGLGAYDQPVDNRQVADDFVSDAVGEVVVGWILAQVGQRQDRDWYREVSVCEAPPSHDGRNDYECAERGQDSEPRTHSGRGVRGLGRRFYLTEFRRVAALGQLDNQSVVPACSGVVLEQPRPQPRGLAADGRVPLRVETRLPPENLNPDDGLLEVALTALHLPLDDESQEPGQAFIADESGAFEHPLKRSCNVFRPDITGFHGLKGSLLFSGCCRCIT